VIHDDHPFQTPPGDRDPVRQFRGRLVAPVTVVTAGTGDQRAGLTVSSLMVAEGDPGSVFLLVGNSTELWDQIESTGRFIVHVVDDSMRDHGDAFAGFRPRPGGMFTDVELEETAWGPVMVAAPNRLFCSLSSQTELPFHHLVEAVVDQVDVEDLANPAIYFRGSYRRLEEKN
jgi:flavin reductase (DIM6/NTAB) family NADH-FMN oxidoreductase RutF